MTFNVNEFRSNFKHEPAVLNKFRVEILPPVQMLNVTEAEYSNLSRIMSFRAKSAELPFKILATYEQRDHGPVSSIAYDASYSELTIEFIMTESFVETVLFKTWMEFIIDNEESENSESRQTGGTNYVGYYDDYVGTIKIDVFGVDGRVVSTIILREAYPLAIQNVPLSWDASDVATMSVQFKYKRFDTIIYQVDPSAPARLASLVNSPDLPLSGLEILNGTIDQITDAVDSVLRKKQNLKNIVTVTKNRIETGKAQIKSIRDKIERIF